MLKILNLGIIQKSYYNESVSINNLTISGGPNHNLFSFDTIVPAANNTNYTTFIASFTTNITDDGNYTIFINASDKTGFSDSINFTLSVDAISHNPIMTVVNQTTAVNRI